MYVHTRLSCGGRPRGDDSSMQPFSLLGYYELHLTSLFTYAARNKQPPRPADSRPYDCTRHIRLKLRILHRLSFIRVSQESWPPTPCQTTSTKSCPRRRRTPSRRPSRCRNSTPRTALCISVRRGRLVHLSSFTLSLSLSGGQES
jgi:hypothetical protein